MRSPPLLVTALVQTASVATTSANDPRAALSNQAARTRVNQVVAAYIGLQKKSLYKWFQLLGNDPLNQGSAMCAAIQTILRRSPTLKFETAPTASLVLFPNRAGASLKDASGFHQLSTRYST